MNGSGASLYVHEVFPSFQGEGLYCGAPQVFVRLSGCNLACAYCDTPEAREHTREARVSDWEGERAGIANPVAAEDLVRVVSSLWTGAMHSVSLTGGEPLLQAEALAVLLPRLKGLGMPVYLETNGTLGEEAGALLPWLDFIAMDVKLPSFTQGVDLGDAHRGFLRAVRGADVFLKMVVDMDTSPEEVAAACMQLGEEAARLTLVLQPAWKEGGVALTPRRARDLALVAAPLFAAVRVLPQAHKAWGIR
ncbi:MAG: 7-carboxy-7-deazaguanine synthase QueE [Actinobacteria bacterium]|nr:7-carboxy-7-deazaguanine synthase QueE [Actinomycetota bacterium]